MQTGLATLSNTGITQAAPAFSAALFERFIAYTDVKETTIKGYVTCLRQFAKWLQENGIDQPAREDVKAYKKHLEGREYSAGTQAQYLRAVKHFFRWTAAEGIYPNVADNIKGAKVKSGNSKKEAFNEEDVRRIVASIDTATAQGKRALAMVLLSVTGGLRIIEMQRANIGDIQTIKGQRVLFIQGKGRDEKDEYAKLTPEVEAAINDYLETRPGAKKSEPLFTGTSNRAKGARISEPSYSKILKEVFKAAGYDSSRLTAHSLRHTSNTLLFKAGADLYTVQKHARHADPKTTEIYIHAAEREADQSEQAIYNQIFAPEKADTLRQLHEIVDAMSADQQEKALEALQAIKKGSY